LKLPVVIDPPASPGSPYVAWCPLEGFAVAGAGSSPEEAIDDFRRAWTDWLALVVEAEGAPPTVPDVRLVDLDLVEATAPR
jgi:hypothetical protein